MSSRNYFIARVLFLVSLTACYFYVGLRPFQFAIPSSIENSAKLTGGLLRVKPEGLARASEPPTWLSTAIGNHQLDIELVVRPLDGRTPPRGTIFAISHDSYDGCLTINQSDRDLVVNIRLLESQRERPKRIVVSDVFAMDDQSKRIRLRIEPGHLRLEVDSSLAESRRISERPLGHWTTAHQLTLANERGGNSPWYGEISTCLIRVDGTSHDHLQPQQLDTPNRYWRIASWPQWLPFARARISRDSRRDIAVNFFGFLPFGIVVCLISLRRRIATAITCSLLLSLAIEGLQLVSIGRFTSTTDIIMNTLGGGMGALVGTIIHGVWRRTRSKEAEASRL